MVKKEVGVVCGKCGFVNPSGAKFCLDCGKRVVVSVRSAGGLESLSLLHLVGSVYILVSILFNEVYRLEPVFLGAFLVVGFLGLVAAYGFYAWSRITVKMRRLVKAVSLVTIALGFSVTFMLFYLGLGVSGVIGPVWVVFVVAGWKLWVDRKKL